MADVSPGIAAGRAARQTERYWFEDGIPGIAAGLNLLAASVGLLILELSWWTLPFLFVVGTAWGVLTSRAMHAAKERFTYPRTGYVVLVAPEGWQVLIGWVIGFGQVQLWRMIGFLDSDLDRWLPTQIGLIVASALGFGWFRLRLGCAGFLAIASIAFGLGASLLVTHSLYLGAAAYCAAMGSGCLISGVLAYRSYSRAAPDPENV